MMRKTLSVDIERVQRGQTGPCVCTAHRREHAVWMPESSAYSQPRAQIHAPTAYARKKKKEGKKGSRRTSASAQFVMIGPVALGSRQRSPSVNTKHRFEILLY